MFVSKNKNINKRNLKNKQKITKITNEMKHNTVISIFKKPSYKQTNTHA